MGQTVNKEFQFNKVNVTGQVTVHIQSVLFNFVSSFIASCLSPQKCHVGQAKDKLTHVKECTNVPKTVVVEI